MLPSDLLSHRRQGETLIPKRLPLDRSHLRLAEAAIALFEASRDDTQGNLDRRLKEFEGDRPDYRLRRGLAHLLKGRYCTFEIVSPLDPIELRSRVFTAAAQRVPKPENTLKTLELLAQDLSQELERDIPINAIVQGLYADLQENRRLTEFNAPHPEALLHHYNLSQVQGIFYRASDITIQAHRNVPGQYKLLFRYLKLFSLMFYIEGDADCGFTITIDGPTSLFKPSTRYGLAIAKLLPALLHVSRWSLKATLQQRDSRNGRQVQGQFSLDSDCGLVSHYPAGKAYDSMLEQSFAERWAKLDTPWELEREVDLIPIPGSVMVPDFRLIHPDGREVLLEIVGYWRPEYLRKKFSQVRQGSDRPLLLAVSERLNLAKAGVNLKEVSVPIVWFKDKLQPKAILAALEPADESQG
ncbi:DUF790 family protein [Sodalinema gerasimenkoae]|uniref:DUF790 family protein n=1 Tax=Sodalinema gerasimenkoae TaxID=2862348 RepID=UPI00135C8068|nr:DUF790 family protein [Sodalinema gerasimenkoae]